MELRTSEIDRVCRTTDDHDNELHVAFIVSVMDELKEVALGASDLAE